MRKAREWAVNIAGYGGIAIFGICMVGALLWVIVTGETLPEAVSTRMSAAGILGVIMLTGAILAGPYQ